MPSEEFRDTLYLGEHWYNADSNASQTWWKEKQPIEPIIRQSLICAIELAGDLPIDSYWVPIGNRSVHPNKYHRGVFRADEYPFEVVLSRGEWQLTRLIITPPSPRPLRMERYIQPTDIWIVQDRDEPFPKGGTKIFEEVGVAMTQLYEQPEPASVTYGS
ncbi:MAG: hypothetical protein ETSY1_42835 [Candidatus Entotheonella factor]|uniref:Uncharacterized protein n=1 Tax=Entotheonella factor TaxID=1429438 RepID=W4L5L1_ENTF1|nr:MAG: hypothetical protein ETSY1_42835 [Candidatus Entotheonella factor]